MGDAFKNHVFPKYEKSRVIKPQMKGLEDPTLNSFSLLNLSALMKPELKDQMFEDEFIRSFLNAAKVLAAAGRAAIRCCIASISWASSMSCNRQRRQGLRSITAL